MRQVEVSRFAGLATPLICSVWHEEDESSQKSKLFSCHVSIADAIRACHNAPGKLFHDGLDHAKGSPIYLVADVRECKMADRCSTSAMPALPRSSRLQGMLWSRGKKCF